MAACGQVEAENKRTSSSERILFEAQNFGVEKVCRFYNAEHHPFMDKKLNKFLFLQNFANYSILLESLDAHRNWVDVARSMAMSSSMVSGERCDYSVWSR